MRRPKTQLFALLTAILIGLAVASGTFADQGERSQAPAVEPFAVLETIGQLIDSALQLLVEAVQAEADQGRSTSDPESTGISELGCPDQNAPCANEIGGQGEPWG